MMIAGTEIPNDMITTYIRAIRNVRSSPTAAADALRMDIHNAIIEEGGTTRHDYAFLGALSDVVHDLI